jgi:hypothetical protein
MSKAVKSDGSIQKLVDEFIAEFDDSGYERITSAIAWLSEKKENGHQRLDDVNLSSLWDLGSKYKERTGEIPPVIKKYVLIKLQQGKRDWSQKCEPDPAMPAGIDKKPWD